MRKLRTGAGNTVSDSAHAPNSGRENAAIMPHKQFEATLGATDDDKAKAFAESPTLKAKMAECGVIGKPEIYFLRDAK